MSRHMSQHWNPTKNIQQTTYVETLNATYNINHLTNKLAETNVFEKSFNKANLKKSSFFCKNLKNHHFLTYFEKSSFFDKIWKNNNFWNFFLKNHHFSPNFEKSSIFVKTWKNHHFLTKTWKIIIFCTNLKNVVCCILSQSMSRHMLCFLLNVVCCVVLSFWTVYQPQFFFSKHIVVFAS